MVEETKQPATAPPLNFALIGAGGYIAPRHLKAIKATGNRLIAALDKNDSVGIMDSYFPEAEFFTEFERFDRHAEKLRRRGHSERLHYVSICSPNYLHDAHMRFALRLEANAICEKPLVISPWNLDALEEMEKESGRRIYSVLQLRLHPAIIALKEKISAAPASKRYAVNLTYITARGKWYFVSWKGDEELSGGIATNIGIHFFDLLTYVFGGVRYHEVHCNTPSRMAGYLDLEKADVRWFLSVDRRDIPESAMLTGKTTYRSITVEGEEIEFSSGFTDLHTLVYQDILQGGGFGIEDVRPSVSLVYMLRKAQVQKSANECMHPLFANRIL
jgi:UDP-N-acetyl-2-amino-2-deoxyglucuronate dehydrogenase